MKRGIILAATGSLIGLFFVGASGLLAAQAHRATEKAPNYQEVTLEITGMT